MAISNNPLLKGYSGHINRQIVVKQYGEVTVMTKFPDMSGIKPSGGQVAQRKSFTEAQRIAVAYLKANPSHRAELQAECKDYQRPYNLLISKIMKGDKRYTESIIPLKKPVSSKDERKNPPATTV